MGEPPPDAGQPSIACRGCTYDLLGLPAGVCPECGRAFDPADPSTFWDLVARTRAQKQRRARIAAVALVACSFAALFTFGVIPRPAIAPVGGVQWGFWVWLGRGFGVQRVDMMAESLVVHRWGNRVSRIDAEDRWSAPTPRPRWSLERTGPDEWRMEVVDPTVDWRSLLLGFNTMRRDDELFGVVIHAWARDEAGTPFTVHGSRVDVLSAMIRVYGMETHPGLTSPEDGDVWVVSPESGELVEVPVARALEMGIAVRPFEAEGVPRIEVVR
jgi:hypothetical protein